MNQKAHIACNFDSIIKLSTFRKYCQKYLEFTILCRVFSEYFLKSILHNTPPVLFYLLTKMECQTAETGSLFTALGPGIRVIIITGYPFLSFNTRVKVNC